ncbi:hypothetical protein [Streptomyces sp. UNOC14_S4]|uniref:hypothetical protein n=1 Tax=Streptomyces sp. UNOC14_S4 TaxID=2872340 RepID=UPI001E5B23E0|nr:hypothetical protein [Streptomyces sp. UNOC14_S4]MCC3772116.1 hypothetical protein [Streptomyces sp. UNOC14_S4]
MLTALDRQRLYEIIEEGMNTAFTPPGQRTPFSLECMLSGQIENLLPLAEARASRLRSIGSPEVADVEYALRRARQVLASSNLGDKPTPYSLAVACGMLLLHSTTPGDRSAGRPPLSPPSQRTVRAKAGAPGLTGR